MSSYAFIIPEQSENKIANPSFETGTTGYVAVGAGTTLAQDFIYQRFGRASLKVTPDTGINDGVYYGITLAVTTQYTFSVYVLGANGVPYRLRVYDVTGAVDLATKTFTGDGGWMRVEVTFTTGANTSIRLHLEKNNHASIAPLYADGSQLEQKGYSTTYVDGDQDEGQWTGARHASTSTRSAQERGGGRAVDPETYGLWITASAGMGMLPRRHASEEFASQPGAYLQDIKLLPRVITLAGEWLESGELQLLQARRQLVNALHLDAVNTLQPVGLRYTGVEREIELPCYYDDGLAGNLMKVFMEKAVIRLIAYDPFWIERADNAKDLNTSQSLTFRYVAGLINGVWSNLGPPAAAATGGIIDSIICDPNGPAVYFGGNFTDFDGKANADYIVKYDTATGLWSDIGAANGDVQCLLIGPDGTLYASGLFTSIGGTAANRIAKYDGSSWAALGAGLDNSGSALLLVGNRLYVGGSFTITPARKIAYYDLVAGTWNAMSGGANNPCLALALLPDGRIAVGGTFTAVNTGDTIAAHGMAIWDPLAAAWSGSSEIDPGATAQVFALLVGRDNHLYIGGKQLGSGANKHLGRWRMVGAVEILADQPVYTPNSLDTEVYHFAQTLDGTLYIGGVFDASTNGLSISDGLAQWDGQRLLGVDAIFPTIGGREGVGLNALAARGNDLFVGISYNNRASALTGTMVAGQKTAITNDAQSKSYPRFVFKRSGGTTVRLRTIRNLLSGERLIFAPLDIMNGETITIDLRSKRVISDFRGDIPGAINPSLSKLGSFSLLPGTQDILVFVEVAGSPTITAYGIWRNRYESFDGASI